MGRERDRHPGSCIYKVIKKSHLLSAHMELLGVYIKNDVRCILRLWVCFGLA